MTINATYFDGLSALAHPVRLERDGERLAVIGDTAEWRFERADCRMAEPFSNASRIVEFADGSHVEVAAGEGGALAELMRYVPSRIERWQHNWWAALAAVAAMFVFAVLAYIKGIPALSNLIVDYMPVAAEQRLGNVAQAELASTMLRQSRFSEQRLAELDAVFERVRPLARRMPVRLLVQEVPGLGANAMALPNGTVIVTDELVKVMIGKGEVADARDELAAIMAHEIGHIEQRHSLRSLAQSSLTLAGSWALFGDFSAVAAGLPALMGKMRYSRDMEFEADAFAGKALRRLGLSPAVLGDALSMLEADASERPDPSARLPDWMRVTLDFMSTHPDTPERAKRLQEFGE